jgi:NAD(P)-dependent dehydrogenase (short-subunit alcohol dehydrogenase family)
MKDLGGKVAVVTGGASGIGRAMAERFAAEGMKIVLADVEEVALAATATALGEAGREVLAVRTDVSKAADVEALLARTLERFGAVHVLCNNAGVASGGMSWERSAAEWEWVLGVNLWGVIHGIRTFVPRMLEQKDEAHIVNTASIAGLVSVPAMGPYCVSKHGVVTLSEVLHHELSMVSSGRVQVSVLCPGWVQTQIHASHRNRPDAVKAETTAPNAAGAAMEQMVRALVNSGIQPSEIADAVLTAIREGKFYILTHPQMTGGVKIRMDDILLGRPPTLNSPR